MTRGLTLSVVLHVAVAVLAFVGLPEFLREREIQDRLVVVDVVTVGAITNAPPPAEQPQKPKPPTQSAQAKPEPTRPTPPPPTAAAAPPPPAPRVEAPKPETPKSEPQRTPPPPKPETARPEPPKPEPAPRPQQTAEAEPIPLPKVKPEPKPEEPKRPEEAKKPEPKPEPPAKPEPDAVKAADATPTPPPPVPTSRPTPPKRPEKPQVAEKKPEEKKPEEKKTDDFMNVLKTVQKLKESAPKQTETAENAPKTEDSTARRSNFDESRPLSVSEMDAIRQQIARCWLVPAGAKEGESLLVEIRVVMNPDRTVRDTQIVDSGRMRSDPFFRAAAESALRALRNPSCSPLNLPPEKYETWKSFTITFDPRDMLS